MRPWQIIFLLAGTLVFSMNDSTRAQTTGGSTCQAFTIQCPISGGCLTTPTGKSAFGMRVDPFTHKYQMHTGVDYQIPAETPILAAADGTIETSKLNKSLGEVIVLRHANGAATLYAHLKTRQVLEKATVKAGTVIGLSDTTGNATGPHLHFEYVPNGAIIQSPNRIDPAACIGKSVNGSVRVFDNGSAADDAFRVTLDGVVLGETQIGASNTFAANSLRPGNHTLVITAIVAPDNDGTYEVDLSNGITFNDGSVTKSGDLATNASVSFTIVVPS